MSKSRQTAPLANPVTAARESHTPGPWIVVAPEGQAIRVCSGERPEDLTIGYVTGHGSDSFADASLIAAAPDLLAALERLEHSYMLLSTGKPVRDMAETLGEVHHALKKARGK